MEISKIYLIFTIVVYSIYFLIMLPTRLKDLSIWKKYHYDDNKNNDCKNEESYKCINYGNIIEKYIIGNLKYIGLRSLCLFNSNFIPLVFLNNIENVSTHLLRWKKWGFHYFGIYHIFCLLFDICIIFFPNLLIFK